MLASRMVPFRMMRYHVLAIGRYPNSYAIQTGNLNGCWLAGERHQLQFELPEGVIQPSWKRIGFNVYGCGLVLDPENKLCIFFTLNGKLFGELVIFKRLTKKEVMSN
jgi:hypothetical protein